MPDSLVQVAFFDDVSKRNVALEKSKEAGVRTLLVGAGGPLPGSNTPFIVYRGPFLDSLQFMQMGSSGTLTLSDQH